MTYHFRRPLQKALAFYSSWRNHEKRERIIRKSIFNQSTLTMIQLIATQQGVRIQADNYYNFTCSGDETIYLKRKKKICLANKGKRKRVMTNHGRYIFFLYDQIGEQVYGPPDSKQLPQPVDTCNTRSITSVFPTFLLNLFRSSGHLTHQWNTTLPETLHSCDLL